MNGAKLAKTIAWSVVIVVMLVILIAGASGVNFGWGNWNGCNGYVSMGGWYGAGRLPSDAATGQNAQQPLDGVRGVTLDFIDENIEVVLSDEDAVRVEQKSNAVLRDEEIMRYGMINGEFVAQSGHYGRNTAGLQSYTASTVTLYIPQKLELPLSLSTTSGTIRIGGGTYQSLSADTMSGEISGEAISAKTIDADSASGSITLTGVSCDSLSADTMSGEIVLSGDADHTMDADSTSGGISFEGGADRVSCGTMSGDIRLTLAAPKTVNADSTSGSIFMDCSDATYLKEVAADTASGSIRITLPENEGFTVSFDSVSGSLHNQFETVDNVHKNGKIDINVDSTSGSLDILRKS